jgi:hypothetical protein
MRILPTAIVSAVALCTAIASPQAASIGTAANVLRATDGSLTERVAYRRCWWRQGVRYCRRYRTGYAPYYYRQRYYYPRSSIGLIMGIQ